MDSLMWAAELTLSLWVGLERTQYSITLKRTHAEKRVCMHCTAHTQANVTQCSSAIEAPSYGTSSCKSHVGMTPHVLMHNIIQWWYFLHILQSHFTELSLTLTKDQCWLYCTGLTGTDSACPQYIETAPVMCCLQLLDHIPHSSDKWAVYKDLWTEASCNSVCNISCAAKYPVWLGTYRHVLLSLNFSSHEVTFRQMYQQLFSFQLFFFSGNTKQRESSRKYIKRVGKVEGNRQDDSNKHASIKSIRNSKQSQWKQSDGTNHAWKYFDFNENWGSWWPN